MYKNSANISKNRLYVTFKGRLDVNEIDDGGNNVIQEARKLKKGFGIISDISEFVPTNEEGRLSMQNTMKTLKEMGVGHVVRIVKSIIAGNQWQRTSKQAGYAADEVETLNEAEALLDKLEKSNL